MVAEEVKNLADEAQTQAGQIEETVEKIQTEIDDVASANEQQTAKVFKVTFDLKQLSEEY